MEKEIRNDIKGINRFVFEAGSDREQLHLHISEVGPGSRAHPPHTHEGQEIFYVFSVKARSYLGIRRIVSAITKPSMSIAKFYTAYAMSVRHPSATRDYCEVNLS